MIYFPSPTIELVLGDIHAKKTFLVSWNELKRYKSYCKGTSIPYILDGIIFLVESN
jgi:hypothetical protein